MDQLRSNGTDKSVTAITGPVYGSLATSKSPSHELTPFSPPQPVAVRGENKCSRGGGLAVMGLGRLGRGRTCRGGHTTAATRYSVAKERFDPGEGQL